MKRIDNRTVEYTDQELPVEERFQDLLDQGKTVIEATIEALPTMPNGLVETWVDPEFVAHLSDDAVILDKLHGTVTTNRWWDK